MGWIENRKTSLKKKNRKTFHIFLENIFVKDGKWIFIINIFLKYYNNIN